VDHEASTSIPNIVVKAVRMVALPLSQQPAFSLHERYGYLYRVRTSADSLQRPLMYVEVLNGESG
jgi:hypothetical protein